MGSTEILSGAIPTGARKGRTAKKYEVGDEWLTIAEAAGRCGASVHSLRKRMERYGEKLADAMEYYRARPDGRKGLTQADRKLVDRLAEELLQMNAPETAHAEEDEKMDKGWRTVSAANGEPAAVTENETPKNEDFDLLKVFNRAIDALRELDGLEVFDDELESKVQGLIYDMDLKRWKMFGKMVNWNEIAKGR